MSDDMLKTIEMLGTRAVSRRSFLRGGAIAAAIIGAAAAAPAVLHGQNRDAQSQDKQDKKDSKKPSQDQSSDTSSSGDNKVDAQGREYRECPQCGGNMYQQGRTWTCENCGYSYVE